MNKILNPNQAIDLSKKLKGENKAIVLVGGVFDILHVGHLELLKKAASLADTLFIFLESDESVAAKKGQNRPINTQVDRAKILASIDYVDYVIALPFFTSDEDYDQLVSAIKPAIIATTTKDEEKQHKKRQAEKFSIAYKEVAGTIENKSSTKIADTIQKDL